MAHGLDSQFQQLAVSKCQLPQKKSISQILADQSICIGYTNKGMRPRQKLVPS